MFKFPLSLHAKHFIVIRFWVGEEYTQKFEIGLKRKKK